MQNNVLSDIFPKLASNKVKVDAKEEIDKMI